MTGRTTVELRFPRDVGAETVVAVLRSLSGVRRDQRVVFDTEADRDGIRHLLTAAPATLAALRGILRAELPGLRLSNVTDPETGGFSAAVRWRLAPRPGVLRNDDVGRVGPALLAALQPLAEGERLLIRLVIGSGRMPMERQPGRTPGRAAQVRARALQGKAAEPGFRVRLIAAATAGHPKRADHLLGRVSVVVRSLATPHGWLRGFRVPRFLVGRQLASGGLGLWPDALSAAELAGLLAWPTEAPSVPGLSLGAAPLRMPSREIPSAGRRLARANWPGAERDLCLSAKGALGHALVAGPTGVGKSALLLAGIADTITQGFGVLVVDGRGDLAEDVLGRVPEGREVVVLDPGAGGPVPGLKLHGGRGDAELLADVVHGVLHALHMDSWGPLSERYVRLGLVTLAQDPAATLADFPYLFGSDEAFRRRLVGRLRDPLLAASWQSFEAMGAAERSHAVAAPLGKVMTLIGRPSLRAVLGQTDPKLDLAAAMRRGQVVVVNLATGTIGAPAARLLGALVVHALYVATQARARIAPGKRRPFLVFIDEPQTLNALPVPLDLLLEQARGLGVGLTISVQSVSQLPKAVSRAALTNAATLVAFRQNADDARLLARELDGVSPDDLQALGQFEVTARIGLGDGAVSAPVTGLTFPPDPPTSDPEAIRKNSAARYGMEPAAVDAALFARHEPMSNDAPIGRTGRTP